MRLLSGIVLIAVFSISATAQTDSIPPLNQEVLVYVQSVIGKQVDRGECWDLANQALTLADAKWDKIYVYGRPVNYQTEAVYPGDIVHFKGAVIKRTEGFTTITETMEQHTAIIIKVYGKGVYELAHQNTSFSGRKVGTSPINIEGLIKGDIIIYRPEN